MHGDGEWDARAALLWLGESLALVGVAVAGLVSGGSGGMAGWRWNGWVLDVSSRVLACGAFWVLWAVMNLRV